VLENFYLILGKLKAKNYFSQRNLKEIKCRIPEVTAEKETEEG